MSGLAQARERARRLEVRNRRLAAAVVALLVVAGSLAIYLWNPGPLQRAELRTVDARFAVRGARAPDPRLVLLAVDDRTLSRRGTSQSGNLRRADYARIVNRLHADGAAVIALDVIFEGPSGPNGDRALLEAIRATRDSVVLAFQNFTVVGPSDNLKVRPQLLDPRAVEATEVRTGYAGLPLDLDDRNRRADYRVVIDPTKGLSGEIVTAPGFAFVAADVARGGELRRRLAGLPKASRRVEEDQSTSTTWIDFRGSPGTLRRVSALGVLEGRVARGTFRDKVVVVGRIAPRTPLPKTADKDEHRTPLDRGSSMPGSEVQANALDTMLQSSPLRDVSRLVDILAILVLACVPAVAGLSRSRAVAAGAIVVAAALYVAAVQLAFKSGWIVALVVPLTALAAATLAVVGLTAARVVRSRAARRRSAPNDRLSSV